MTKVLKLRLALFAVLIAGAICLPVISWATGPHDAHGGSPNANVGPTPHAEAAEEAEHSHWPPAPMNFTDFSDKSRPPFVAMVVNFVLLIGIYYVFGKKPIAAGLQARRDNVAKQIEEANRIKKEAQDRAKMYQAKLARLEEELQTARQALVEAGQGERERIIREAEEKAARMRRDADLRIEQEIKQMRQDIWREAVEQAVVAAEDLLKKRVTQADQERLAEQYLSDLAHEKPATAGGGAS
jgi:F-type H+-transporting ATPase subunit b